MAKQDYLGSIPIFDDESFDPDKMFNPSVDGERKGHGLKLRDWKEHPEDFLAPPSEIKVYSKNDWSAMLAEKKAKKANLSDYRTWDALDQNGQGFCWMYSGTGCVMVARSVGGQPYVRLSAHAGACLVKSFKDEGGWCGLGLKHLKDKGQPSIEFWAEKSMDRRYNTPQTWENALLHRVTEDYVDLTRQVWDQNLAFEQVATCLLNNDPCCVDMNWWGHSICALDLVEIERGSFGLLILNSWSNAWGDKGTGILRGSKAIPDGAVCIRTVTAAAA